MKAKVTKVIVQGCLRVLTAGRFRLVVNESLHRQVIYNTRIGAIWPLLCVLTKTKQDYENVLDGLLSIQEVVEIDHHIKYCSKQTNVNLFVVQHPQRRSRH